MAEPPDRTYLYKQYRRTKPGGGTGELVKRVEIKAPGLAQAEQIAAKDHLSSLDFKSDFAILEGDEPGNFVRCWLTGYQHA